MHSSMRQDVFESVVAFEKKGMEGLSDEMKRYIERDIKLGKRNGKVLNSSNFIHVLYPFVNEYLFKCLIEYYIRASAIYSEGSR